MDLTRRLFGQALAAAIGAKTPAEALAASRTIPEIGLIFPSITAGKAVSVADLIDEFCKYQRLFADPQAVRDDLSVTGFLKAVYNGSLTGGGAILWKLYATQVIQANLLAQQEIEAARALLFGNNRYGQAVNAIVDEYWSMKRSREAAYAQSLVDIALTVDNPGDAKLVAIQATARQLKDAPASIGVDALRHFGDIAMSVLGKYDKRARKVYDADAESRNKAFEYLTQKHNISKDNLLRMVDARGKHNRVEELHGEFSKRLIELNGQLREEHSQFALDDAQIGNIIGPLFETTAQRVLTEAYRQLLERGREILRTGSGDPGTLTLENASPSPKAIESSADEDKGEMNPTSPPNGKSSQLNAAKPDSEKEKLKEQVSWLEREKDRLERENWPPKNDIY